MGASHPSHDGPFPAGNAVLTCCSLFFLLSGSSHEPRGKMVKVNSKYDAYLAQSQSKSDKIGLLYLPDVLGVSADSKLLADELALNSHTILVLDLYNGDSLSGEGLSGGFDIERWMREGSDGEHPHTTEVVDGIVQEGVEYLKGLGYERIGAVGYCFGGRVSYI